MRTWCMILAGVLAGASLLSTGCTPSEEPEKQAAPAPAPAAPAPAPGQPPAAAPQGTAGAMIIDELYVDAEAEPDEGTPPLAVTFTSIVEDATGAVTCEWDFGDGTPKSTEMNPKHTYQKEGDYVVILKCKDSKGIEGETEIDVTAYEYE